MGINHLQPIRSDRFAGGYPRAVRLRRNRIVVRYPVEDGAVRSAVGTSLNIRSGRGELRLDRLTQDD